MSYTHSWYRIGEIEPSLMDQIRIDFFKINSELPDDSQILDIPDFWGEPQDLAFGGKNGTCEPMVFCRVSSARKIIAERAREPWMLGKYFEFCKTERMLYDLPVKSLLIIAKKHLSEDVRVFSDGVNNDWVDAIELCKRVLGYREKFCIKEHELVCC